MNAQCITIIRKIKEKSYLKLRNDGFVNRSYFSLQQQSKTDSFFILLCVMCSAYFMDFTIKFAECYSVIEIFDKSSEWIASGPLLHRKVKIKIKMDE